MKKYFLLIQEYYNIIIILQVAVLSCLAAVQAQAGVPVGYAGYGYPTAYAGLPAGYNAVPAAVPAGVHGGVYGANYDPSVAYANLCESE